MVSRGVTLYYGQNISVQTWTPLSHKCEKRHELDFLIYYYGLKWGFCPFNNLKID